MEILETVLWIVGVIVFLLAFAGLQRAFFPHAMVNGFMDLDKLKAICPELFNRKEKDKRDDSKKNF
jgi:hypothetical protein